MMLQKSLTTTNMDGIETTRALKKIVGPEVTIIIMIAYDWASIEKEAKRAGGNLLISKPLFRTSFSSVFEKIYSEQEEKPLLEQQEEYDFTGKRVLLVEDHLINIKVAKYLLVSKNLEVEVAENGLLGIEAFAAAPVGLIVLSWMYECLLWTGYWLRNLFAKCERKMLKPFLSLR